MSLTLPVEELCRFVVLANISDRDGRVALTLKPSLSKDPSPQTSSGLSIHFETVEADGGYVLSVFTSSRPPVTSTTPYPTPEEGNTPEPVPSTSNQQMDSNSIRLSPMNDDLGTEFDAWLPSWSDSFISELNNQAFTSEDGIILQNLKDETFQVLGTNEIDFSRSEMFNIAQDLNPKLPESHTFNDALQPAPHALDCPVPDDAFFCPSPATSSPHTERERTENVLQELDHLSVSSSPSPDSPQSPSVQRRWRRVACLHPGCDRQFVSAHTRRIHMRTHEPKARQYFPCTMGCTEAFSRQHDRMRHEVTKHGRECKWACKQCRRFFSFEKTLKNHKCSGQSISRWSLPTAELDQ